jgi:hypothetical protein
VSTPRRHPLSHRRGASSGSISLLLLVILGTAACGSSVGAPGHVINPVVVSSSLATSIETPAGSWAVVPMGDLDQPLNTFWQLFFRPEGSSTWSDETSALAVATNGGLVLAPTGRSLAVGIRPSNLLEYSPLLLTSGSGRSWSPASPIAGLAGQPDSLAMGADGAAVALTTGSGGQAVLESAEGLAGWRELTSVSKLLASPAGRSCDVLALTAVNTSRAGVLIGGDCRKTGVSGLFSESPSGWLRVGPALPAALEHGLVDVLSLQPTAGGLCALLAVSDGPDTSLEAAWTSSGSTWIVSPVLDLGTEQVTSVGADGKSGLFVLATRSVSEVIEVLSGPGRAWSTLPDPPAGTQTLVFGATGKVDALSVDRTTFTDWSLPDSSGSWTRAQVIDVPIEFGSSS